MKFREENTATGGSGAQQMPPLTIQKDLTLSASIETISKGDNAGNPYLKLTIANPDGQVVGFTAFDPNKAKFNSPDEEDELNGRNIQHILEAFGYTVSDMAEAMKGARKFKDEIEAVVKLVEEHGTIKKARAKIMMDKNGYSTLPSFKFFDYNPDRNEYDKNVPKEQVFTFNGKKRKLVDKPFILSEDDSRILNFTNSEIARVEKYKKDMEADKGQTGTEEEEDELPFGEATTSLEDEL
jgi:hypothetical protein